MTDESTKTFTIPNTGTVSVDESCDVLLVDFSYFCIYRYYALMAWFKLSETEYDEALFFEKYKKLFVTNINKVIKKFSMQHRNVILVGDCGRKNIWRQGVFNKYKENRDKLDDKENAINPKVFTVIYDEIVPQLQKKGMQYVCVDHLEADDIVYRITRKIDNNIVILTNDNDYLQMVNDRIRIVNLPSFKSIHNRCTGNPESDLRLKILCGDPSDNIPSLMGKKQAMKIIQYEEDKLDAYLNEHSLIEKYELNRTLIDMRRVPEHLMERVIIKRYSRS
jgi:5'-3' exonuclease